MTRLFTRPFLYTGLLCLWVVSIAHAQGRLEDYARANRLKAAMDKLYYAPATVTWSESGQLAWYLMQTPRGSEFMAVNPVQKTKTRAFDQEQLARQLAQVAQKPVEPYQLPFSTFVYGPGDRSIRFRAFDYNWSFDLSTNTLTQTDPVAALRERYWGERGNDQTDRPVTSPDGTWQAFIKNHNLYLRSVKTREEVPLTFDGAEGEYYSGYMQWSPDSKKLVTNKVRPGQKRQIYFVRSSPDDQLQPKLESRDYLKPGDALPVRTPHLFLIAERKHLVVDNALFQNQYELTRPEWRQDSRAFTFEYNQRGHQVYRVLEVDAVTGKVRAVVDEQPQTFFYYMPVGNDGKRFRQDLADGREVVWMSERDGWNHLYLYDGLTGTVKNQITKGEWVVRNVIRVDEQARTILFAAGGVDPKLDPYFVQYYRINFDGTGLTALTPENANHRAFFSPDHRYFIDTYSRVDMAPVTVLRSTRDGSVVMPLENADLSAYTQAGWRAPEVFTAKARDGKTDIWGVIVRPTNFNPKKKYPVIEYIYAGPHSAFAPKSFITGERARGMFELAELGFIVVQLDGMGTSHRSKAFHDVCWQNLKDAGFPDRILWMQAAARKDPSMDLSRVGIYGNSAGGQSTVGGLLFHPEFYKVGVSSSGCHDNRMDKIWWNEQWMGYPIGPHYAESSNVTHAGKLQGKLLLILGEVDDNVDPASTMQLINALIKANKDFDFLMVPNMGHSMGGDYGERKRRDFFVRHLLGVEPPAWSAQLMSTNGQSSGR
ncbi:prolyl oligopeptidase family serine peptidase [Rudanella paleaurantiibacter]|uniref:Prolyl oligopeptidase family serine peptidase n=1 Tax=Rudanella paleaurantiibacter TaxID=2614655 RepID=A0A7J5TXA9_9BACT|nr:S9 family peptidase [Rudanella paleaurantiibacter]KAB7729275.1 prolyl oligopeptidase family serine peptidase [Rudanella paleaurantiibacter]